MLNCRTCLGNQLCCKWAKHEVNGSFTVVCSFSPPATHLMYRIDGGMQPFSFFRVVLQGHLHSVRELLAAGADTSLKVRKVALSEDCLCECVVAPI